MKTPAFSLLRLAVRVGAAGLLGLVLVRLGVWAWGGQSLHGDVVQGPEIFVWEASEDGFGGLSALVMAPDGLALVAGGDRGHYIEAQLTRDPAGQITAITPPVLTPVSLASGRPPSKFKRDLEALSPMPGGRMAQAFEGFVRIEMLGHPTERPTPIHRWDQFAQFFGNTAFEALATLPDGRLLAISERKSKTDQAFTVIHDGKAWQQGPPLTVPDGFAVTGADVGPDGCLYVVERRYGLASGFSARLRRLQFEERWQGTLIYATPPAALGNIEAVSSWQDSAGNVVLTLVADNNFLPLTPTRLIELRLRPEKGCALDF